MQGPARVSLSDVLYATNMALACFVSYSIMVHALVSFVDRSDQLLGGMWSAVATVFVFRETRSDAWRAGMARLLATSVSFALCLLYLWFFPFRAVGMAL